MADGEVVAALLPSDAGAADVLTEGG